MSIRSIIANNDDYAASTIDVTNGPKINDNYLLKRTEDTNRRVIVSNHEEETVTI